MNAVFIKLFDVTTVASISIILTLLFRPLLKKCPSFIRCILWCVILLRLLMPFTIDSGVFTMQSVPSAGDIFATESVAEPVQPTVSQAPVLDESKVPILDNTASTVVPDINATPPVAEDTVPPVVDDAPVVVLPDEEEQTELVTEKKSVSVLTVLSTIWAVGVAAMLLYMAASSIVLRFKTRNAIVYDSRIRIINAKTSPFVRGIIRPTVYIPADLDKNSWKHIIAHENAHIKRLDHLVKPMAFVALATHWYNPFVWVAYVMLCKDIEYACDEKAVKEMDHAERQAYSLSLLSCAAGKSLAFAHPLAFGKVSVKERIKRIMNYKVSVWAICLALVVSMLLGVLLACSPGKEDVSSADGTSDDTSYEQSEYFGSLIETTDDSGHHKGFTLKADEWGEITEEVTNELLADIHADFAAIWADCDFVAIDFGKESSLTLEKSEYELPGNGYGYTASLSTPFNDYSFVLYDTYYDFKHIKMNDGKLVFEKPSAFGEADEHDTDSLGNVDKLLFIRLLYGLKPDANRVRNYSVTSGVYSDAATIVISPTQSVVCWRGIDVTGHWWISVGEKVKVLYSDEFELKNDLANETVNVLEFDDGGHEIVKIMPSTYLKNFKFITIEYDESTNPKVGKVLYEADELNNKQPFYARTMINEGLSFRGVVYTDSLGFTYYARIMYNPLGYISYDGDLYLECFTPQSGDTSSKIEEEQSDIGTAPVYSTSKMVITTNTSNAEFIKRATAITGSRMYFSFDTAEKFKSFKADFADVLYFDKGWGECKSFNEEMAEYTDKFFEDNTLVLVYFISGSESFRYSIEGKIENGKTLRVTISQINNPDIYNMMQVAWFGVLAFPDDEIASCTEYKSNLGSFEYRPDAEAITTAYANWSENSLIYTEALNKDMLSAGNRNGLPMYRIDNEADEEAFKKTFENVFGFDSKYDEVGTVNTLLNKYDNKFYENGSLVLVYVTAGSGSYRYSIDKIMIKDNNFFVCVKNTVNPELITADMAGWLIAVQVNDSFLDNSDEFNAIMTQA